MSDPIKLRAQLQGDIADIRVLLQHPMETGMRRDDKGQTFPAHFIQTFSILLNGALLLDGQLNTAISKNPLFAFKARGIKTGDKLTVSWMDSMGTQRKDEFTVG